MDVSRLLLKRPKAPDVDVDLDSASFIAFIQVGDHLTPVYEGWWLVATPHGSVAIFDSCPMVAGLLRAAALAPAAEAIPDKFILFLSSRPMELRGREAADGVALLDAEATASIKGKGVVEQVARIADLPIIQ